RKKADDAGHLRFAWPKEYGGKGGSNLWMAVIREHLASKGLGLFNDLQTEHSIVGNNPFILMFKEFATDAQYELYGERLLKGEIRAGFGLTEPNHGSDATWMETRAVREQRHGVAGWRIDGEKMWTTGMHVASHVMVFARTSGADGDAGGITVFLVPADAPGVKIEEYLWTFNMPTDHPRVSFTNVFVPDEAIWGVEGRGLGLGQSFVHQNRIRQAASSLGAAVYCIEESVKYARARKPFGEELARNQAIQFPLVELATQAEMLRLLIRETAWRMDHMAHKEVERQISDRVSMCNYWGNRLCCEAADLAMQVHGGIGYSRHKPFEHIYRHHRRYRITEGSEEIQMRKVAAFLFGYLGPRRQEMSALTWDEVDYRREGSAIRSGA
ncbi:MAG: acyl-CoA dehydrogenase family protein, partial [Caulobacteraceae bacterium]|nr:acyl-CoA dehydrogenase family protein [Caulobacteraceae bacterium]